MKLEHRLSLADRLRREKDLLGDYAVGQLLTAAVQECPETVLEHLLPWFVRVSLDVSIPASEQNYATDMLFAYGWHEDHIGEGSMFAIRISQALCHLAKTHPSQFRSLVAELTKVETLAVHRVLAQAYLCYPEEYAGDMFEYLIADNRRLNLGDLGNGNYDSCRLYNAALQHGDDECRTVLEQLILDLYPQWEKWGLGRQGITQLHFLKSVWSEGYLEPDSPWQTARIGAQIP